jgi:hypothetical protein
MKRNATRVMMLMLMVVPNKLMEEALERHAALVDLLLKSNADEKLEDKDGHIAKDFIFRPKDSRTINKNKDEL